MTDQRHPPPRNRPAVQRPLLLVVAAASGAFDLPVMLRHVPSWIMTHVNAKTSASVDSKKSVYRYLSKMAYSV